MKANQGEVFTSDGLWWSERGSTTAKAATTTTGTTAETTTAWKIEQGQEMKNEVNIKSRGLCVGAAVNCSTRVVHSNSIESEVEER